MAPRRQFTLLTCQKRAAAPKKPGELSMSFVLRLWGWAGIVGSVHRVVGIVL